MYYAYDYLTNFEISGFHKKHTKIYNLYNNRLRFLQIKKIINYISRATLWQKKICSEGKPLVWAFHFLLKDHKGNKATPLLQFLLLYSFVHTVKPALTTTFLKWPPVLNDHAVVLPYLFRSNFSLYSDQLYNATNDHLNDFPGFLLPEYNDCCTKCLS